MSDEVLKDCGYECGCTMEMGAVIHDDDQVFTCELSGTPEKVEEEYRRLAGEAEKVSAAAKASFEDSGEGAELVRKVKIEFSCTAENIIFQLRIK